MNRILCKLYEQGQDQGKVKWRMLWENDHNQRHHSDTEHPVATSNIQWTSDVQYYYKWEYACDLYSKVHQY